MLVGSEEHFYGVGISEIVGSMHLVNEGGRECERAAIADGTTGLSYML